MSDSTEFDTTSPRPRRAPAAPPQINVPERRLVCSERAAMLDDLAAAAQPGDVLQARAPLFYSFF